MGSSHLFKTMISIFREIKEKDLDGEFVVGFSWMFFACSDYKRTWYYWRIKKPQTTHEAYRDCNQFVFYKWQGLKYFSHSLNVFPSAFFTYWCYFSWRGVIPYGGLYLKPFRQLIQPCHDQQRELTPQFCKSSRSKYLLHICHFWSTYVSIALKKSN